MSEFNLPAHTDFLLLAGTTRTWFVACCAFHNFLSLCLQECICSDELKTGFSDEASFRFITNADELQMTHFMGIRVAAVFDLFVSRVEVNTERPNAGVRQLVYFDGV